MTNQRTGGTIGRRGFLTGTAGLAGATLLMSARQAFAQAAGRVAVGTWGGDYAKFLSDYIDTPFMVPQGYEIVQEQAGDPERRAKMVAERRLPRGSIDVNALQDSSMYQMFAQGLADEIDYDRIPNAANLLPNLRLPYGVAHIFSGMVALYNPDHMDAPTGYADVFTPDLGDRLGIIDIQYRHNIGVASLIAGGSVTAVDEGQKLLMELRRAGARIYPTNEAFAQGLQTEEIHGGAMWKARSLQWQAAGINVLGVTPSEGFIPYMSGFIIPKNAPNKDGAYAWLNAALEPQAQLDFAENMGYASTVSNASIPDDLQEKIGFTDDEIAAMNPLDFEFFTDNDLDLKNWWDQEFKG